MQLDWIELIGFRSYPHLEWRPGSGLNVLVGPNGIGKTNILEAVGYLSRLRSFRRNPDDALIGFGEDAAIIRGGFRSESSELKVEISLPAGGRRQILFNAKRPKRHADVAYEIPMVTFLPDDLDIVKRSPGLRRDYIDELVAQLSSTAGADLGDYDRALRQRNSLLRMHGREADFATLDVWDERVAIGGALVVRHRLDVIEEVSGDLAAAYRSVSALDEALVGSYQAKWLPEASAMTTAEIQERLVATLLERRRRDMEQRTTSAGPHRDDISFTIQGDGPRRDLRTQASQGEQRSAALALRMAAFHVIERRRGAPPILLLDDVLSELDPLRSRGVMELLPRGQVFLTTAREEDVAPTADRWAVTAGEVGR